MLQTLLQSELAKAPKVNSGLRDVRARINALGNLSTDESLLEAVTLLYTVPPGVPKTRLNVHMVNQGVVKATPMIKILDEDFI